MLGSAQKNLQPDLMLRDPGKGERCSQSCKFGLYHTCTGA